MKHLKLYKYIKIYEGVVGGIYPELFSYVSTKEIYPRFSRGTSLKRLKTVKDFKFYKEFLDEVLLNKKIIINYQKEFIEIITINYRIVGKFITFYDKYGKYETINEMQRFRIGYDKYPEIGPMEKAANEYLETLIAANKYNL